MARKPKRTPEYFSCPHCGAQVEVGAMSCRECGSDRETGWSEDAEMSAADLPAGYGEEDDFDYDQFVRDEFPGTSAPTSPERLKSFAVLAIVVIVCLGLLIYSLAL